MARSKTGPYGTITAVVGMIALLTWAIIIFVILSTLKVDMFVWYLFVLYIIFSILAGTFGEGAKREQEARVIEELDIRMRIFLLKQKEE